MLNAGGKWVQCSEPLGRDAAVAEAVRQWVKACHKVYEQQMGKPRPGKQAPSADSVECDAAASRHISQVVERLLKRSNKERARIVRTWTRTLAIAVRTRGKLHCMGVSHHYFERQHDAIYKHKKQDFWALDYYFMSYGF